MALLDDIIEAATDDKTPIGNLLRKCLVLEQQVKNEKFKAWLDNELDGYDRDHESDFPSYRVFNCVNKGFLIGITFRMNDQPLSLHVMEEKDRKLVEKVYLHQPAASYEGRPDKSADAGLPWPPSLTAKYQTKFFADKDLVLNRAWQEIPGSVLVALLEQVRTRVLRFALELKDALPASSCDPKQVPAAIVERSVINNFYGGNILIASHAENIAQIAHDALRSGPVSRASISSTSSWRVSAVPPPPGTTVPLSLGPSKTIGRVPTLRRQHFGTFTGRYYWRSVSLHYRRRLVFSLEPRCHGLCGSQK